MRYSLLPFVALAAATPVKLPVVTPPSVASGNGISNLGKTLTVTAGNLGIHLDRAAAANASFSEDISANVDPAAAFTGSINNITREFWKSAYDVEKRVCAISQDVNPATVDKEKADLVAGVQATAKVIAQITTNVQASVANIEKLTDSFTAREKAVIQTAINALSAAAKSSVEPISALAAGLQAAGVTGLANDVNSLEDAASVLASTAANVKLSGVNTP